MTRTRRAETFVDAVLKSVVPRETALPESVNEGLFADYDLIDNHLAVRGAAVWNAKEAVTVAPNVMVMD